MDIVTLVVILCVFLVGYVLGKASELWLGKIKQFLES